jgi:hypothetical protein
MENESETSFKPKLFQDIGFDRDNYMEVVLERGSEIPHEYSFRIKPNGIKELCLYEGNHIDTEKNKLLGKYPIIDDTFTVTLKVSETYDLSLFFDEQLMDTLSCSLEPQDVPLEEKRRLINAHNDFIDYINSTILFVEDPLTQKYLPEWKDVLEKLNWAKQIEEYEVSADEYIGALHEIEGMVNPILQKTQHKMERKSPFRI